MCSIHQSAPRRVRSNPFAQAHEAAIRTILGRAPTLFEKATGAALWRAYEASRQAPRQFKAVSAATGAGKTKGAVALMASLFPARSAIVVKEIREAHEVYLDLCKLLGEEHVAIHTSVHRVGASSKDVSRFTSETGHTPPQFTEEQFRRAPVVVCTHKRWQGEIINDTDRGVRLCDGQQRDLIIVDEEPGLERVFVAQPEGVSRLASVLTDTVSESEARHWFGGVHPAVVALSAIHQRMRTVKDTVEGASLLPQDDLVDTVEIDLIRGLTRDDIYVRLGHLSPAERITLTDELDVVRQFLVAACEGRVFFAKGIGSAFYAYSYAIPPQRNTIILDGTADLNGLYAVGKSVITLDTPSPSYAAVKTTYIGLPKEHSGLDFWNPRNVRSVREAAPFMEWFRQTLLANTQPGEEVLVYCPKVLLDTDLHHRHDEAGADQTNDRDYYCEWEGRRIHWCHFGSGRGTNRYKDCTVFFQIRAFYKPKAAVVAQIGSVTGEKLGADRLRSLSSGRTSDPLYTYVRDSLIAVDTKQNAARICIRKLDDSGKAARARLYFVGDDLHLLSQYHQQMFPGAPEVHLDLGASVEDGKATAVDRMAHLLAISEETLLVGSEVLQATGLCRNNVQKTLKMRSVRAAMETRGWRKVTRKDVGLPGKGWVLQRNASLSSNTP